MMTCVYQMMTCVYHIGIVGILLESNPGTDAAFVSVTEQQGLQKLLQLL